MSFAPVYLPPPRPPRQRGGFILGVLNSLAITLFFLSICLNFYLIFGGRVDRLDKTTLNEGDSSNVIAVIPITGEIADQTAASVDTTLKALSSDASIKAVVLRIDTPGGSVSASDEIYEHILALKKLKGIPVIASIGALGTSGGYYVACAADQIVAERTSWTGNIGVLLPRYNIAELANKYGVKETTLHSTGSDFKDAGSIFKDDTPAQTAYWQGLVDEAFGVFKQVIREGRKLDPTTVDVLANGKVYSGPDAQRLKLVDQVGYLDDAIGIAISQANLGKIQPQVVEYDQSKSFLASLSSKSSLSSGGFVSANVGNVDLKIDRDAIDNFLTPRPMYLWQGH